MCVCVCVCVCKNVYKNRGMSIYKPVIKRSKSKYFST